MTTAAAITTVSLEDTLWQMVADADLPGEGTPAGLYLRISADDQKTGLGVERQLYELLEVCRREELGVLCLYVENDRSATRKADGTPADRPEFQRLCDDIAHQRIQVVVAWKFDRIYRDNLEREEFLELCRFAGLDRIVPCHDEQVHIPTRNGMLSARLKGILAAEEIENIRVRTRSKKAEAARNGLPSGGPRPYGWKPGALELDEAEAAVLREAANRILQGRTLSAYVKELNEANIPTAQGKRWRNTMLRDCLLRPRIAGFRVHQGRVVGRAQWEPVLPVETWEAVCAILRNPKRRNSGRARSYLLTGLVVCGACRNKMYGGTGGKVRGTTNPSHYYVCRYSHGGCGHVAAQAHSVEERVLETMFAAVSSQEATTAALEEADNRAEVERLLGEIAAYEARATELALMCARGQIAAVALQAGIDEAEALAARTRDRLSEYQQRSQRLSTQYLGEDVLAEAWPRLDADEQKAIVRDVVDKVVIQPRGKPKGRVAFDPMRVEVHVRPLR